MKTLFTIISCVLMLCMTVQAQDSLLAPTVSGSLQSRTISLDHVDGLHAPDSILAEIEVVFHIRMTNDDTVCQGFTNGFRIYSPDGADWTTTTADSTDAFGGEDFDYLYRIHYYGITGSDADTVGFAGCVLSNPIGMPASFDSITHTITLGPIDASYDGKTICLDSSYFPPQGYWQWAPGTNPAWDGPHCFTVFASDDIDGDGIPNENDNCPIVFNPNHSMLHHRDGRMYLIPFGSTRAPLGSPLDCHRHHMLAETVESQACKA